MVMDGFQLLLQDYCSYCPEFEAVVEQTDCTLLGDSTSKMMNNIRCQHEVKCANIARHMKGDSNHG